MKKSGNRITAPQLTRARALIRPSLEAGEKVIPKEFERQYGISADSFERALHAELARMEVFKEEGVAPWTKSQKERLQGAINAHKKKLNLEFEGRVIKEIQRRINSIVLPSLLKREADASRIVKGRKGSVSKEEYRLILSCLHPDRVPEELKKKYEAAFHIFKGLEKLLLDEKELPTNVVKLPTTYADLMARRKVRPGGAKIVRVK